MKQKCKECKSPIPKGLEKYVKAKKVCEKCYFKLRKNGDSIEKMDSRGEYLKWLKR